LSTLLGLLGLGRDLGLYNGFHGGDLLGGLGLGRFSLGGEELVLGHKSSARAAWWALDGSEGVLRMMDLASLAEAVPAEVVVRAIVALVTLVVNRVVARVADGCSCMKSRQAARVPKGDRVRSMMRVSLGKL